MPALPVLGLVVVINVLAWSGLNRPIVGEDWSGTLHGVAFSPFSGGQKPGTGPFPSAKDIARDLALVHGHSRRVRTYSALDGLERVPELAAREGMRVVAGAWIGPDRMRNLQEIDSLIALTRANHNIDHVIVGNEVLLRGDIEISELVAYVRYVRDRVRVPVSTAEPWHVWVKHPELAEAVDFVAIHVLPYWEGVPIEAAVDHVFERYAEMQKAFPKHPIMVAEVGWPSGGPTIRSARPGVGNQSLFLRGFLNRASAAHLNYFVFEAFDQPWKLRSEGTPGAYWGLFDSARQAKFEMSGPVAEVAVWPVLCAVSILLAFIPMAMFLARAANLRYGGKVFYAGLIQLVASAAVAAIYVLTSRYATAETRIAWGVLSTSLALVALIVLTEGLEFTRLLWRRRLVRTFVPDAAVAPAHWPRVSIHVPAYNEPPEMLIETLEALARLDYPDYEVLVIDNNTRDPALWRPVEARCAALGPRFRFFHVDKLAGFKAGALNFALGHADPAAEVIAVIDSDYVVQPDWLRALVPYFGDATVGFVQAPQDYRDWQGSAFKSMCNWEYAGFFHLGMVERNEHDAIIQHGTMTMIRRAALVGVGGWSEWCITEDAELGLKLHAADWRSVYVAQSFGRGLTPDTFSAYKGQRFRWTYGAVQILKRHWRALLPGGSALDGGQRYHYIVGWLPWFADALNLLFTVLALGKTAALLIWTNGVEFPLTVFLTAVVALTGFKFVISMMLYRTRVRCSVGRSIGAAVAALSLSYTIAKAVLVGLFSTGRPFLRTPKLEGRPPILAGLAMAWEELALFGLLWAAAASIVAVYGFENIEALLWVAVLLVQSLAFAAAVAMTAASLISESRKTLPSPAPALARPADALPG